MEGSGETRRARTSHGDEEEVADDGNEDAMMGVDVAMEGDIAEEANEEQGVDDDDNIEQPAHKSKRTRRAGEKRARGRRRKAQSAAADAGEDDDDPLHAERERRPWRQQH